VTIALVAAMDAAGLIGVGGRLPWHLPADLAHFRVLTMGGVVVMGRRTWESLPGPLEGRENVVVSRRRGYFARPDVTYASALLPSLQWRKDERLFIIGGASVYAAALPLADALHLTRIAHTFPAGEGAVYFPARNEAAWRLAASEARAADAANPHAMVFERWERR
jgi:dihydrofolate reductase